MTKGRLYERHSNLPLAEYTQLFESPLNQFSLQENIVLSSWVYLLEWLIWMTDPETTPVIGQRWCKHTQVCLWPLASTVDVAAPGASIQKSAPIDLN